MTGPEQPDPSDPYAPPQPGETPPPPYGAPSYGAPGSAPSEYGAPAYGAPPYGAPSYGTPTGELALWPRRVGGRLIDGLLFGVPTFAIGLATGSRVVENLLSLVALLIIGYLNGATGQTPGKRVVGVRLVRERDGQLLGAGMGIVREIAHFVDTIACFVGWLWPLWDQKRQTFADKMCGSLVVRT